MMSVLKEIFRDHVRYRRQILKLAKSDLIKTYKGAALGWSWAVIRPALTIAMYYFAFSVGLRVGRPVAGYPYYLYLIAGMMPWFYISGTFVGGAASVHKYSYLVTKVRYPVSTIPTFVSLSKLATNAIVSLIVLAIFVVAGKGPDLYWLQLPFYFFLMFAFFTVWSLFAGLVSVVSKDFMHLVNSLNLPLFWLSGILYDVNSVSNRSLRRLLLLNPITIIANGYRDSLIYKVWFWEKPTALCDFGLAFLLMALLAMWAYKRLVKTLPDVL